VGSLEQLGCWLTPVHRNDVTSLTNSLMSLLLKILMAELKGPFVGQSDLSIQSQSHIEPHSHKRSSSCDINV